MQCQIYAKCMIIERPKRGGEKGRKRKRERERRGKRVKERERRRKRSSE